MSTPIFGLEQAIAIYLAYHQQSSLTDEERRIYNIAWGKIYNAGAQLMRTLADKAPQGLVP